MTLIVVNYHYVRPRFEHPFPGIHGVTPPTLEAQLQLLGGAGEFVSLSQVRAAVQGGPALPARACLVTFDDGLREQADHALPILDRLGIPAVCFVSTRPIADATVAPVHKIHLLRASTAPAQFHALLHAEARRRGIEIDVGGNGRPAAMYPWDSPDDARLKYILNHGLAPEVRDALIAPCFRERFGDDEGSVSRALYMGVEQLRMLAARGYLGTHGDRHLALGRLPQAAAREDVGASLDRLAEWTGVRPFALSYPFGVLEAATPEAGAAAAAVGVEFAFTTERAANVDLSRPLHLARFDCNDLPGARQPCLRADSLFSTAPPARWYR